MSDVDIRMKQFRSLMEPALHIFPPYLIRDLEANGFFTAPASTKYHGAFEGGLFEHSRNVTQVLITLTHDNGLAWQRPESPYIIGMFHDLCKMDLYRHPMSDAVLHAWDANGQKRHPRGRYDKMGAQSRYFAQRSRRQVRDAAFSVSASHDGRDSVYPVSHGCIRGPERVE